MYLTEIKHIKVQVHMYGAAGGPCKKKYFICSDELEIRWDELEICSDK
jgi:hypothetical protein